MNRKDPWELPEWHSLGREAALVRHLVGSGATAIGRANYADRIGDYYSAFFGLSIGLERLAKLILIADSAILNGGRMPNEKEIKKYGHNILSLLNAAQAISERNKLLLRYQRPSSDIHLKIIECLDNFADAGRGRYANFSALGSPNLSADEPISKWWNEVAEMILAKHYYGKKSQIDVEGRASIIDELMSAHTAVFFTNESGVPMQDVLSASIRTGQNVLVQNYGRFYSLEVVRWVCEIFCELASIACGKHGLDAFFGVWEYLATYRVEDRFLKTRKNWPLF